MFYCLFLCALTLVVYLIVRSKKTIIVDGKKYLSRYYVLFRDWELCNIYVHHFHSSDQGMLLHSHPWQWAISFVIVGGYYEEKLQKFGGITRNLVRAPALNVLNKTNFHRVDLLNEKRGSWSIVITGPRCKTVSGEPDWGFWDRNTGEFIHMSKVEGAIP